MIKSCYIFEFDHSSFMTQTCYFMQYDLSCFHAVAQRTTNVVCLFPQIKKDFRCGGPAMKYRRSKPHVAATAIQAAYRGHLVRKTQPLKHLRIIRNVRTELQRLEHQLAADPRLFETLRRDPTERLKWSEGGMALLLQLDSMQATFIFLFFCYFSSFFTGVFLRICWRLPIKGANFVILIATI